jgi:hypothetical protein
MPTLPSDAIQSSEASGVGSLQTMPDHSPTVAASPYKLAEDKTTRLLQSIDELKSLLSVSISNYPGQPSETQQQEVTTPGLPSTAQERTKIVIDKLDRILNHDTSMSSSTRDGGTALITNSQPFAPASSYLHPNLPAAHDVAPILKTQAASIPSMSLKNCVSGQCHLPPPSEGSSLLNEYLHDFNSRIPLFNPETIRNHVRECYSGTADQMPLKFVLAYIAIATGYRLRAMTVFAIADDTLKADFYLNKCLAVLPDLLLQEPTLQLIQALLGVALLLYTSHRSKKAALFVSTAMRLAQDLSYNEYDQDRDERLSSDKQEIYVFWIAFLMDTSMNLRANRPNTQKLVDISVPLPDLNSINSLALDTSANTTGQREVNLFALHSSLAVIQAEALEELFSVKARQQSPALIATSFRSVISKLQLWRRSNPLAAIDATRMLSSMYRSDVMHSVMLEGSYFEFLYQLHAANTLGAFHRRIDVFSADSLRSAAGLMSFDIYSDAQRMLELANLVSQGDLSVTWLD